MNETLIALCKEGKTLADIAAALGVSRQRVHQLLSRSPELAILRKQKKRMTWLSLQKPPKYGEYGTRKNFFADPLRVRQQGMLRSRKSRASASREFSITWFDLEWPSHCPVLGIKLDYHSKTGIAQENAPSLDRINSSLGYVKGNVHVISWRANRIKNDGTASEHEAIAKWMKENC
jgi:hypothetical protein